jgi:hypothetical protein
MRSGSRAICRAAVWICGGSPERIEANPGFVHELWAQARSTIALSRARRSSAGVGAVGHPGGAKRASASARRLSATIRITWGRFGASASLAVSVGLEALRVRDAFGGRRLRLPGFVGARDDQARSDEDRAGPCQAEDRREPGSSAADERADEQGEQADREP